MNAEARKQLLALAAHFLREYAERLSNDGCNDWRWPEWLSDEARSLLLSKACHEFADADFGPPNWSVADCLAEFVEQQS